MRLTYCTLTINEVVLYLRNNGIRHQIASTRCASCNGATRANLIVLPTFAGLTPKPKYLRSDVACRAAKGVNAASEGDGEKTMRAWIRAPTTKTIVELRLSRKELMVNSDYSKGATSSDR